MDEKIESEINTCKSPVVHSTLMSALSQSEASGMEIPGKIVHMGDGSEKQRQTEDKGRTDQRDDGDSKRERNCKGDTLLDNERNLSPKKKRNIDVGLELIQSSSGSGVGAESDSSCSSTRFGDISSFDSEMDSNLVSVCSLKLKSFDVSSVSNHSDSHNPHHNRDDQGLAGLHRVGNRDSNSQLSIKCEEQDPNQDSGRRSGPASEEAQGAESEPRLESECGPGSEPGSQGENSQSVGLFDLLWEDTLFVYCLPLLSWEDLFNLRRVSTRSRALLSVYFSQLKRIDLSQVRPGFNEPAFKVITENCKIVRKVIIPNASWLRDENLNKVFRSNRFLTYVDLSGCRGLNGSCMLSLAVNCKSLTTLLLRECLWLTRGAVETLMAHLRLLKQVDFTSCAALCNNQITSFVQVFPRLTRLHLAFIQAVNDLTLIVIARTCRDIMHLDIRACMCVTDHGIRALAEFCPKLKTLSINNCNLVTDFSLRYIRSRGTVTIDRPCLIDPELLDAPIPHPFPRLQV